MAAFSRPEGRQAGVALQAYPGGRDLQGMVEGGVPPCSTFQGTKPTFSLLVAQATLQGRSPAPPRPCPATLAPATLQGKSGHGWVGGSWGGWVLLQGATLLCLPTAG